MADEEVRKFISEDDLTTFEEWLRYQGAHLIEKTAPIFQVFRRGRRCVNERTAATPKVGLMKLRLVPGEYRYAVAVRENSDLWLMLWVKRSPKGEFFIFMPRGDRSQDPHASYHLDGTLHQKSSNHKFGSQKRQPLTGTFRGRRTSGCTGAIVRKASGRFAIGPPSLGLSKLRLMCWGRAMAKL